MTLSAMQLLTDQLPQSAKRCDGLNGGGVHGDYAERRQRAHHGRQPHYRFRARHNARRCDGEGGRKCDDAEREQPAEERGSQAAAKVTSLQNMSPQFLPADVTVS